MNRKTKGTPPPRAGPSRAATLLLIGAVLGAAVVLFAWMNTESVPVTVFLWEPELPKALLMFGPLLVGFLLGWGTAARRRGRDEDRRGGNPPGEGGPRSPGSRTEPGGADGESEGRERGS